MNMLLIKGGGARDMKRNDKQLVVLLIILILLIVACAFIAISIFGEKKPNKSTSQYSDYHCKKQS